MDIDGLVAVRKAVERAVADMADTPLKVSAFEVMFTAMIEGGIKSQPITPATTDKPPTPSANRTSLSDRISLIADDGFFSTPRSLAEIQQALSAHGWHYAQPNLSTPLVRLVRNRQLRRLSATEGNKCVWKYSLP